MRQDKKLILGMTLLFFITFVSLGTLVTTEKLAPYYTNRIKTKINNYLETEYKEERNNLKIKKITYKNQEYKAKIVNKDNENLYFTVSYHNKKIKDTYKEDYLEGKTILTTIEKKLEKKILKNLNLKTTITIPLKLNKYTKTIQQEIMNNKINNLNIYNIELTINNSLKINNIQTLITDITNQIEQIHNLAIQPNRYTIKIKGKNKNLTIKNLTNKTLEAETLTQIINYIMLEEQPEQIANIINENNISYEYTEQK